jgi:hypothetical protein
MADEKTNGGSPFTIDIPEVLIFASGTGKVEEGKMNGKEKRLTQRN